MLFTGDTITGKAQEMGLIYKAVSEEKLDDEVEKIAEGCGVPINQLMMQKLMINQAYENMGKPYTNASYIFYGSSHIHRGINFKNGSYRCKQVKEEIRNLRLKMISYNKTK